MADLSNNLVQSHTPTRRDFIFIAAGSFAGLGGAISLWPILDSFNPSADVRAVASIEINLEPISPGQRLTVLWRGKPVFIDHRTPQQIRSARADDKAELIEPETDAERVQNPDWLIVIGICTHLGCIPQGQRPNSRTGKWGGWFCSCHGSQYDTSGRVRVGPAPRNLAVPPYKFISETLVKIG